MLQQFLVVDLVLRHEGFGQSTVCGKDYQHSGVLDWGGSAMLDWWRTVCDGGRDVISEGTLCLMST